MHNAVDEGEDGKDNYVGFYENKKFRRDESAAIFMRFIYIYILHICKGISLYNQIHTGIHTHIHICIHTDKQKWQFAYNKSSNFVVYSRC